MKLYFALMTATVALSQSIAAKKIAKETGRVSVGYVNSETDYEQEESASWTVDREVLVAEGAIALTDRTRLLVDVGIVTSSKVEGSRNKGDGFIAGFGLQGRFPISSNVQMLPYGKFEYVEEEARSQLTKIEWQNREIAAGIVAEVTSNPVIPFVGLEILPVRNGDLKVVEGTNNDTVVTSFEREKLLNLRVGARGEIESVELKGEIRLIAETTFAFGVGVRI